MPSHADYEHQVKQLVDDLLDGKHVPLPKTNNALAKSAQKYALAKMLFSYGKKVHDTLRDDFRKAVYIPPEANTYVLLDTPHVFVQAQVKNAPRTLSENAIKLLLMERLELDEEAATELLDTCRGTGTQQVQIVPMLKK